MDGSAGAAEETSLGRSAFAEFLGTAGIVVFGAGAVITTTIGLEATGVALASGLAVAAMVATAFPASGGHLNPAVTIGLLATSRLDAMRAGVYVMAQILGAIVGAFVLRALMPGIIYDAAGGGVPALAPSFEAAKAAGIEALLSFFWVLAYIVGSGRRRQGSHFVSLSIGLLVTAGVLVFGALSGAAMNPARWIGPAFAAGTWTDWYVWSAGPLVGGLVGAVVARALFAPSRVPDEAS